ncbi:HlyD family efflux transporter periplasmic adaptor subunit [Bosea sp. BK604]|uniref:efflux RND transporter periplasmic adaptor subunit n=1 Tax=Bosea sp. BK604 TaxID=2512180 RepID=UPI0010463EDB|nr:HlyD family efflux transporter periplasmic adaptor subunit [Bosea sp. BK604]TCR65737.1 biotin/lipoyl-binding protein [Bosea sp. BK604]
MSLAPAVAPVATDPLAERLRELRLQRGRDDWPELVLSVSQDLTLATRGALVAGDPPVLLAPKAPDRELPAPWLAAAQRARLARGVWAGPEGAGWLFAVPVGSVAPVNAAPAPGVLVLEIATRHQIDLALTRERLVAVAALCEAATQAAAGGLAARAALAASAVEAYLQAPDRSAGLTAAAGVLAHATAGVERLALVRISGASPTTIAIADQPVVDRAGNLARLLVGLVEDVLDGPEPSRACTGEPTSPAQQAYVDQFGKRPLLAQLGPARHLGLAVAFAPDHAPGDGEARFAPSLALLERVLQPQPPRLSIGARRRWLIRGGFLAAAVIGLAVAPRTDTVEAPASLQPEWQQTISAPFDGIVAYSTAQPGDHVEAGTTVLARLDTREIELEIAAARARAANELRDATVARAGGQPAQEQLALLSASRAESQLALLRHRLASAELRSPRSGVIVSGDLRKSLGQPVLRGQTLFEIAPDISVRADARVLDEDIRRVEPGQPVRILPDAEPDRPRHGVVERVRPMAEVVQSRNSFLVTVRLEPGAEPLRPGSEGIAHIETGRTTWLMSLLKQPIRYIRKKLWI